jgi:hypothetical protein
MLSSCESKSKSKIISDVDYSIYQKTCEKCDAKILNINYADHILECPAIEIKRTSIQYQPKLVFGGYNGPTGIYGGVPKSYDNDADNDDDVDENDDDNNDDNIYDNIDKITNYRNVSPQWILWIYRNNREIYEEIYEELHFTEILSPDVNYSNNSNSNKVDISKLIKIKEMYECSICYDDKLEHYKLLCNHKICVDCAKNWFALKDTCPICRKSQKL